MPALVHCIYTSVQTSPMTGAEVASLVQHSRESNREHGITGLLLHVRDTFFQVLEGPPEVIDELYASILRDARHTRITRIIYEPIARRYFANSSMTLATLTPEELEDALEEHNPQRTAQLLSDLDEGRAKRLLRAFSEGRWRASLPSSGTKATA